MSEDRAARLADEQEVRDACMRYCAGYDRRDLELYLSAFTAGATISLFGGEIVKKISATAAGGRIIVQHEHTSHAPSSQVVTVSGDTASADTIAICHLIGAGGEVLVRGIRYLDDLVRTPDGWRISHRQHFALWQYDARRVEPHV